MTCTSNRDCVNPNTTITVHPNSILQGSYVNLRASEIHIRGMIDIGDGKLKFEEFCDNENSMIIGGFSNGSYSMNVDYWTLSRIIGSYDSNNFITFNSILGKINVYNVDQAQHLYRASSAQIEIITSGNKNIAFTQGSSTFHTLKMKE